MTDGSSPFSVPRPIETESVSAVVSDARFQGSSRASELLGRGELGGLPVKGGGGPPGLWVSPRSNNK